MRVFRIWRFSEAVMTINGVERRISCPGGSNKSEADAIADANRRLEAVKRRIAGIDKRKKTNYEADIREEPLHWIGGGDVVTRNRYGPEVLNAVSCVIIDIDKPVSRLRRLFRRFRTREEKKQAILEDIERRINKPDMRNRGIRVYETHDGMRVILDGMSLDPRSPESMALLTGFHADPLYATLCRKQNCYRARLTPKPHRIGMPSLRIKYPYDDREAPRIDAWVREYTDKSSRYAVCRLVQTHGHVSASRAVRRHDDATGVKSDFPLA